MKKFFYILTLVAATALVTVSCKKEQEAHEPGPAEADNCYGVYFPTQDASGSHIYNPTQDPSVEILVARTNTKGAITVPVKATFSEDGIFTLSDISFADGQAETTTTLRFDNAKEGTNYTASLEIQDNNYASMYNEGAVALDFSVMRVEMKTLVNPKTNEPAKVTFTEGWWGIVVEANVQYYEVDNVRTCQTINEVVVESGNEDAGDTGFWGGGSDNHLNFIWFVKKEDDAGHQAIDVPKQYLGFDYDDWLAKPIGEAGNPIFAYDWFHYLTTDGGYPGGWPDWEGFLSKNPGVYDRSYYDGNGGFFLNLRYYIPGLGGWTPSTFDTVGIVEGYTRVDYNIYELTSDYTVEGQTPVYIETGVDVDKVKYAIYEGELTATQVGAKVSAISEGTEEITEFSDFELNEETARKSAVLGIELDKTATYTFVVVSFDPEGKAQDSKSITFKHVTAADTETYAVDIEVATEATPVRYTESGNYNEYNSFAFYILGSDITEAHVAVVPMAKVTDATLASLKSDASYAVDEETLAKINGEGGYYDVVGGLNPGVEYAVLVWATNGNEDTMIYDTWTTTPSPEVWKPYGTATWTDAFFGPWFGADPVTYDVALERSEDDPTRFRLVNVYGEAFPYNEPGDWDDSMDYYLVINTADPDYTWFETFDTGCNWGYGNFLLTSQVGRYVDSGYSVDEIKEGGIAAAKYADNKVTFEYRSILKAMANYQNGAWYYGNNDEENPYVIVFNPGATLENAAPSALPHANKVTSANAFSANRSFGKKSFERDPRPVQAKVNAMSAGRKAKVSDRTMDKYIPVLK